MIRLAVDTSSMTQSVALEIDDQIAVTRTVQRAKGHSEALLSTVIGTLKDANVPIEDVDELVCGLGPGSFTGVRIGLSFALGVSAAQSIPVFGVDSMRSFIGFAPPHIRLAVALDARKSEVYGVVYDPEQRREQTAAQTWKPDAFFALIADRSSEPIALAGNAPDAFREAWIPYQDRIQRIPLLRTPQAAGLLIAHRNGHSRDGRTHTLEPRYIRPSDAEQSRRAHPNH